MIIGDNLALKIWNNTQDKYDSQQLGGNFSKLEFHDHTPGKGKLITNNAIADGSITSTKLAVWREISPWVSIGAWVGSATAQYLDPGVTTSTTPTLPRLFWLDPVDFSSVRLRAVVTVNAVGPAQTINVNLNPVTVTYGASNVANSYAGSASILTVSTSATPTVSSTIPLTSGNLATPAAGFYAISVTATAPFTTNSLVDIRARLQGK